jgi:hypothetical protein
MSIRALKWILLGLVLALLFLAHGFSAELPIPPSGQPAQMWSKVDYDPKLTDPFFKSNRWSYPWYIIKHRDGHFEDTSTGIPPEKEPPHLKHTARCFSNSHGEKHLVNFCEAKSLDGNMIDLAIHDDDPAFFDHLRVRIRNGMFTCQFRTASKILPRIPPDIASETKRQKLTLDKEAYRKGDVIKGRIDFECVEEPTNPGYIEQWGRNKTTIKVYGVFKTIVE